MALWHRNIHTVGGCAGQSNPDPSAKSSTKPSPTTAVEHQVTLNRTQVLELLKEASLLKEPFSGKKSVSKKELYDYYDKYFTNQYVEKIILSNMKQEGDKWTIAHPESELKQGTYFETNFNDQTKVDQAKDTITVTNKVEDGLYSAHQEHIMLILINSQWKINDLAWN